MAKNLKFAAALAGIAFATGISGTAIAQDSGLYVGASGGTATYKQACEGRQGPCEDTDSVKRVFGGYRFSRNFALEVGYADLGAISATPNDPATGLPGTTALAAEVTSFDMSGLVSMPLVEGLSAFLRLGYHYSETSTTSTTGGVITSAGEQSGAFTYGVGLGYDFAGGLGARLEWQRWENVGGIATGEDTIDVLSVGVLFKF